MHKHFRRGRTIYNNFSPLKGITILLITFVLLSCGSEEIKKDPVMLLHYFTGDFAQGFMEFTEEINKESKDIYLVSTPLEHEEFKNSIRIQLETNNPPDLFSYWAGARTDYLIEKETISPISSIFINGVDRELFDQSIIDACSYNDELYLFPLTRHFVGFFYSKALFEKHNITPPETWDEWKWQAVFPTMWQSKFPTLKKKNYTSIYF